MTKTIWKFPLTVMGKNEVLVPKDAKVISVIEQFDQIMLYVIVDPNAEKQFRFFEVYGTGHEIEEGKRDFIGTCSMNGGNYIFHVFELKP